jgi:hypothetical protein
MPRVNRYLNGLKIPVVLVGVALLLSISAHAQPASCGDLEIEAPDGQFPWDPFKASLVLAERQRAEIRDVRWTITKHNSTSNKREVETVKDALSVETKAWDANEPGQIYWLVVARQGECISAGSSWSLVSPNPGSPLILDEFGNLSHNDERGRLDLAIAEMLNNSRQELLIFARFHPGVSGRSRAARVQRMFDHMVTFRKFDPTRITFLVSENPTTSFVLQRVPHDFIDAHRSTEPNALMIPAEQLKDFTKLFKK